jgi:protein-tyrosine phosphatase
LKRLTPPLLDRWRFVLWQLHPPERRALTRWVLARSTTGRLDWRPALAAANTVTFVCHGNIIRSPLAAEAFQAEASRLGASVAVRSAGVAARDGEPADPRAVRSAAERGLSLTAHRARFFDEGEACTADVILVMDLPNAGRVIGAHPATAERVFLLGGLQPSGAMTLSEIHDPVLGTIDDVRRAHDEVLAATRVAASVLVSR